MKNTRVGMGKGLGCGYKNLVYKDPYIHGLSAKGVKTHDVTYGRTKSGKTVRMGINKDGTRNYLFLNARGYMRDYKLDNEYSIVTYSEKTRNGFRHVAILMRDGYEVDKATVNYLNRTWEEYDFQTVMHKLLDRQDGIKERVKIFKNNLDRQFGYSLNRTEQEMKRLKMSKEEQEAEEKRLNAIYGLAPRYDSRKSFYGKAMVDVDDKGNKALYSYNTKVAEIKDGKAIVYGTYSATTLRHIKDFLQQEGFKAESSKQIMKDYNPNVSAEEKLKMSKQQAKQEEAKVVSSDVGKINSGNVVNYIMDFEDGKLPVKQELELFSYLIKTGQVWSMQGRYGRTASFLINSGTLDKQGNILKKLDATGKPIYKNVGNWVFVKYPQEETFRASVYCKTEKDAKKLVEQGNKSLDAKSINDLFKLEVLQAVTVPSTEYDRQIPPDRYQRRVREVENYLTKEFGGVTTVQGEGQFMDDDNKKIIREPVKVLTSFAQADGFKGKQKNLLGKMEDWKRRWKQKSMAYQVEDDLYMV